MLQWAAQARRALAKLAGERRGVAAVEFALIAPLLFVMYFVAIEVVQALEDNNKVARIAATVADLVTQQPELSRAEVEAIMGVSDLIIQPYNRTSPKITVTAIEITPSPNSQVKVAWSRKLADKAFTKPFAAGAPVAIPASLNVPGSFIVRVECDMSYSPMITWSPEQKQVLGLAGAFDKIEMREVYYARPRMSVSIPCGNC